MNESYSFVWIYHILFIRLYNNEYLGCFHFLTILNSAAMNIGI